MNDLTQCKVLLVDDTKSNINFLLQALKNDYKLSVALSGERALKFVQSTPPDLILLDIMMPGMDGYEVCRQIKNDPYTRDIPIIFLSAMSDVENKTDGFKVGAVDYITKPFEILEVKARINTHLSLRLANQALRAAKESSETANEKIMASIQYANIIQRSLLPSPENIKPFLPDSFFIWMPRDIVGGDFIFTEYFPSPAGEGVGGFIVAVIDCTGHGVPGAFMTMIASSGMTKIVKDEGCCDPAQILKQLNVFVKKTLQQDTERALSDDGLDATVCLISGLSSGAPDNAQLIFAGAKLPLLHIYDDEIIVVKGDRQSICYKRSDLEFEFTNHIINIKEGMSFYLFSDGFADQLDEKDERRFGNRRFKNLLKEVMHLPFEKRREILLDAFHTYKGTNEMQDDVTVVGFGFGK
ncbi:MAG: hypothetical protein DRI57_13485 [Deltaproteobacteria bacterium]|nr:MAG: hypothetical protein DRI57_13485 [Deltaproteobacteria bacterium]